MSNHTNDTPVLVVADRRYADEVRAYRQEFLDADSSMDGCGALRRCEDPIEYIKVCESYTRPETTPPGRVPATQLFYVRPSDGRIFGMLQIRHTLNEYLAMYAGHIGYSVRPSERRRGYAVSMLRDALSMCCTLGLREVLITCDDGNIGSEKTIRYNSGVYESTVHEPDEDVDVKRFWIKTDAINA